MKRIKSMLRSNSFNALTKILPVSAVCIALAACASSHETEFDGPQTQSNPEMAAVAVGALTGKWGDTDLGGNLSDADRIYAQRTTQDALEYNKTAQTSTWRNPESGNSGTVTPSRTFVHSSGRNCRNFRMSIFVSGDQEKGAGMACRLPDGTWQIGNQS